MKIVMFYHSLVSDWNHGNAHFLRGTVAELQQRGHAVEVYEPEKGWSYSNLTADAGQEAIAGFRRHYPTLSSTFYNLNSLDLDKVLQDADLVVVHEWNEHALVKAIGRHKAKNPNYVLLFHDTHHRAVTDRKSMTAYRLEHYDGVLAFGNIIRDLYLKNNWTQQAWTWHEAADTRLFRPMGAKPEGDIVWIGNWGDDERTAELHEFLIKPIKELGLKAKVYGVRYPPKALKALAAAGIEYGGWLPNYKVPEVFARYRLTVHVPRRPYVEALPGIPTIRPFEALACGIPLITAPWNDAENLFTAESDYLTAKNGREMKEKMVEVLRNEALCNSLSKNGLKTILNRHTCGHRADQLEKVCHQLGMSAEKVYPTLKEA